jgi:hypothetical protein
MKFVRSLKGYDHLWAVRFPEKEADELTLLFRKWGDMNFLLDFFRDNIDDLQENFHVRRVWDAIQDTFTDADVLEKKILGFPFIENLDSLFLPLSQADDRAVELTREKARNWNRERHASWLRVYAIRLEKNVFVITGGAIKLTQTMQDRPHTREELKKMDRCREFLKTNGIFDQDSLIDYANEESYEKQGHPIPGTEPE